tara:strand:- start:250 stop:1647 length:1398 start_codon:yes stop_codon:yes gene_type:complete
MTKYDVIVIGSGPGGYVAAIRCAQLGMKTAIVEKNPTLGGTCLNVGCIPSKALLDSSEHVSKANKEFAEHGIGVGQVTVDFGQMIKRKNEVVKANVDGIDFLMKKNNIDVLRGTGSFVDNKTIKVSHNKKSTQYGADKVIIATGSEPANLPFIHLDGKQIITSTEALSLPAIPKTMAIIGGGIIGVEMGSVYSRLGTDVTVYEYAPSLASSMDADLSRELKKVLTKQGIKFHLSTSVTGVEKKGKKVAIAATQKGKEIHQEVDICLVAVGRKPYTASLGLGAIGVSCDDRGRIEVDENLRTSAENVFAIGDVIKGAMLAHKAEEEGVLVAEYMAGQRPHIHYDRIPNVAYTWPEAAGVGKTEQEIKEEKIPYKSGKFPYKALGRARASMDLDGFIKILSHKETDEILGVHIIGARAADMIMEGVLALEYRASAEDIARMSHPHPTYSEGFKEACLAATENRPLHM